MFTIVSVILPFALSACFWNIYLNFSTKAVSSSACVIFNTEPLPRQLSLLIVGPNEHTTSPALCRDPYLTDGVALLFARKENEKVDPRTKRDEVGVLAVEIKNQLNNCPTSL